MAWDGSGVGRAAERGGSAGTVACSGSFLSGLFSRVVVGLSVPLYQFSGTFFDVGRAISDRSRLLARVFVPVQSPSISCVSVRSCACVELLKTARMDNISVVCPISSISSSHPSLAPPFSPSFDTGGGAFSLLVVLRVVRFGRSCCLSGCGVSSSRPSRCYCSRVGLLCQSPRGSRVSCLLRPRCHAVARGLIVSSLFAPLPRYVGRGAWSGRCLCLRRVDGRFRVRMMWYHPGFVIAGGVVLLASPPSCFCRFRPVSRSVPLLVSLLFVIRPVLRHGGRGDVFRRLFSGGFVACAAACRAWGGGVVSAWRIIISGCSRRGACCVDYVARTTACRSCGIFVS